jgi:hypothetical protein
MYVVFEYCKTSESFHLHTWHDDRLAATCTVRECYNKCGSCLYCLWSLTQGSSPCNLQWRHRKEYKYSSTLSLISSLDKSGSLAPCLGRFTSENDPSNHRIRGWMSPMTGADGWGWVNIVETSSLVWISMNKRCVRQANIGVNPLTSFSSTFRDQWDMLCSIAQSITWTRLFRGKMHSDWFNGIEILQGRWQNGEKVGYCYPSGLKKTLYKWDIHVPLVTKGLTRRPKLSHNRRRNQLSLQKKRNSSYVFVVSINLRALEFYI